MEQWKDIVGYEGLYQISNIGRVKSYPGDKTRGGIRKQKTSKGYAIVVLHNNCVKKTCSVHRLVAMAFVGNNDNKPEVNHLDENKLNNCTDNLQWVTSKENSNWGTRNQRISDYVKKHPIPICLGQRHGRNKKTVIQLNPLTGEIISKYESTIEAANAVGCNNGKISECCTGKRKTTRGYSWRYAS